MDGINMQGPDQGQQQAMTANTSATSANEHQNSTLSDQPEPMDVDAASTLDAPHVGEDVTMEVSQPEQQAPIPSQNMSAEQTTQESTPHAAVVDVVAQSAPTATEASETAIPVVHATEPTGAMAVDPLAATTEEGHTHVPSVTATLPLPTISVMDTSSVDPSIASSSSPSSSSSFSELDPIKKEDMGGSTMSSTDVAAHSHQGAKSVSPGSYLQQEEQQQPSPISDVSAGETVDQPTSGTEPPPAIITEPSSADTAATEALTTQKASAPAPAAVAAAVPGPAPYMPQFRFTTFSSVAPLPTRNVTSNYLKSERQNVLRDRAATGDRNVKTLGKRRKRHAKVGGASTPAAESTESKHSNQVSSSRGKGSSGGGGGGGSSTAAATPAKDDEDEELTASKRKKTIFELFNEYDRQGGGGATEGETEDDADEGDDDNADLRSRRGRGGRKQGLKKTKKNQGRRARGDGDEDMDEGGGGSDSELSEGASAGEDDDSDDGSDEDEESGGRRARRGSDSDSDLDMERSETVAVGADGQPIVEDPGATAGGEATKPVREIGSNVIVIHPGSRNLRIGRASDAYPIDLPHVIARRMYPRPTTGSVDETIVPAVVKEKSEEETAMDVDEEKDQQQPAAVALDEEEEDIDNFIQNQYLEAIEYDLRSRMKAAKRRPVPNAKSQVRSFNTSSRPEEIKDHNDPHKVEWTDPSEEDEKFFIGQKALNLPPSWLKMPSSTTTSSSNSSSTGVSAPGGLGGRGRMAGGNSGGGERQFYYERFWPIIGGKLNDRDYDSLRVVMADLERIWTKVIQDDLKIEPRKLGKYYALLVIPDMYNKTYVTEMIGMLLNSMRFRGVMVQQEAVCATFGAGVSAACVVDIGAEVTKVSCVEDGICLGDSRAVLKYGGDDITRCFTALVRRNGFPYQDLVLSKRQAYYDWRLMEELKEKWCTMNEADLTVQVYAFFVRKPDHANTLKYLLKVYDEVALSPSCLFFPRVIGRPTAAMRAAEKDRWQHAKPGFCLMTNEVDDANEEIPPAVSVAAMFSKKAGGATTAASDKATGKDAGSATAPTATTSLSAATAGSTAPTTTQASPAPGEAGSAQTSVAGTPVPSSMATMGSGATNGSVGGAQATNQGGNGTFVPTYPFPIDPSVQTTNVPYEVVGTIGKDDFSSYAALDVVVAQSIANCGSEERSKKLYSSIILVGGGGMTPGFDRVLEDRLFQALPASLTTVEKVEVLPSPRDLDPRLLVWKGASVLSKLDTAKELWIKPQEWLLLGKKILRERALFAWQ